MASDKRLVIEIELNDEAELGTAVLFFQKLVVALSKFGLTYFRTASLRQGWTTLMEYETSTSMTNAIKEYQEDQLKKRAMSPKNQPEPEPNEIN